MNVRSFLVVAALLGVSASTVHTQRAFDVASIKENTDARSTGGNLQLMKGGGIRTSHFSARFLITVAYQLQQYQVVNAPEWTSETFYDVQAKTSAPATREEVFGMMQTLLIERFKLAFHREQRELDGFALVSTGAAGPNLRPSTLDCERTPREPKCREGRITEGSVTARGGRIWTLLQVITNQVSAPVIDDTHLAGAYDIDLRWSNDLTAPDAVSIYTALQEQLGLRLERRKVPVDMFIIDHIERPSPD